MKENNLGSKIYDDVVRPTAKEFGKTLAFIPRAINVALMPVQRWLDEGEANVKDMKKRVTEKLKNEEPDNIVEPSMDIAVPLIQQFSYSDKNEEIRDTYASLLSASMKITTRNRVHPSYVSAVKEMSPDEIKILHYLKNKVNVPIVGVKKNLKNESFIEIIKYFNADLFDVCDVKENLQLYLENLERLMFIVLRDDQWVTDDDLYTVHNKHPKIDKFIQDKDNSFGLQKKLLTVTRYGQEFLRICE